MTSQPSKFDIRVNPVYQIDFQEACSGKRVSISKRRIRWRFGFSNADAIRRGLVGTDCRGEEHEIVLVWSLTSGKRHVLADGQEVHFSQGKITEGTFETSWTMAGGHLLQIVAHAAPPLFYTPGFRQFDFLLDGCSYFDMPKIFELGTQRALKKLNIGIVSHQKSHFALPPSENSPESYHVRYSRSERMPSDLSSVDDSDHAAHHRRRAPSPPRRSESLPAIVSQDSKEVSVITVDNLLENGTSSDLLTSGYAAMDEFTPPPTVPTATPTNQSHVINNQILTAYGTTAPPAMVTPTNQAILALANEPHTYYNPGQPQAPIYGQQASYQPQQSTYQYAPPQQQQVYQTPQYQQQQQNTFQASQYIHQQPYQTPHNQYAPSSYQTATIQSPQPMQVSPDTPVRPTLSVDTSKVALEQGGVQPSPIFSMQPLDLSDLEGRDQPPMSEMQSAMQKLVNLENISECKETPEQIKAKERKLNKGPIKSKPLPPAAPEWQGRDAKLGDIQQRAPPKQAPSKDIMRTHAFDPAAAQAGMMVLYGASSIPAPQGFGAGAYHNYYQQQQLQYRQQHHQQQLQVYAGR